MKAKYAYSADGVKLSVSDGTSSFGYEYLGSLIYVRTNGSLSLDQALFDGGTVRPNGAVDYFVKDHLGSVRVIVDQAGTVREQNDYYPYGERCPESTYAVSSVNRYKFNGKEEQTVGDLGMLDYGARMYQAGIGRWFVSDPLAEKYYSVSPYAYCGNDPINRVDPTGMIWEDKKEIERLKAQIAKKMESIKKDMAKTTQQLATEGLSDKKIATYNNRLSNSQSRLDNLNQAVSDIDYLAEDSHTYVFANPPAESNMHTVRLGEDGKVYIERSSDALAIHEITHVRQSLKAGGLQFSPDNLLYNAGRNAPFDKRYAEMSGMEIEAYRMQYSFDKSFPLPINHIREINVHSVGNIRDEVGQLVYEYIHDYAKQLDQSNKVF